MHVKIIVLTQSCLRLSFDLINDWSNVLGLRAKFVKRQPSLFAALYPPPPPQQQRQQQRQGQ